MRLNFSRFTECRRDASRVRMLPVKDDRRRNFAARTNQTSANQTSAIQAYLVNNYLSLENAPH